MQNISSKHTDTPEVLATQHAPPKATSMVSDPMDQHQGLPDYLLDIFLHSPGKVGVDKN